MRTANVLGVTKGGRPIESFVEGERKRSFPRARTLNELGCLLEKGMIKCMDVTIVNGNAKQHLRRESGLAIVEAAEAITEFGRANIAGRMRTIMMNVKATTATEGAGLKAGLHEMGPVDGSVRDEGISSKNAMEREALSANANKNSGEAYHNLNGSPL